MLLVDSVRRRLRIRIPANQYSESTLYGHCQLFPKSNRDSVVICCGDEIDRAPPPRLRPVDGVVSGSAHCGLVVNACPVS